ncbi:MAG: hypothetical protein IZT58_16380 [Actinobacteria bacterium]|nr:hypothetical protein [Actinomycetota bacterium]
MENVVFQNGVAIALLGLHAASMETKTSRFAIYAVFLLTCAADALASACHRSPPSAAQRRRQGRRARVGLRLGECQQVRVFLRSPGGARAKSRHMMQIDEKETRMWWIGGIIGLIIWILIAFWPARVASRKGHSWLGYFILSLFFFPLALIMAYVVQDRRVPGY